MHDNIPSLNVNSSVYVSSYGFWIEYVPCPGICPGSSPDTCPPIDVFFVSEHMLVCCIRCHAPTQEKDLLGLVVFVQWCRFLCAILLVKDMIQVVLRTTARTSTTINVFLFLFFQRVQNGSEDHFNVCRATRFHRGKRALP